jgi:hypothetical protein
MRTVLSMMFAFLLAMPATLASDSPPPVDQGQCHCKGAGDNHNCGCSGDCQCQNGCKCGGGTCRCHGHADDSKGCDCKGEHSPTE